MDEVSSVDMMDLLSKEQVSNENETVVVTSTDCSTSIASEEIVTATGTIDGEHSITPSDHGGRSVRFLRVEGFDGRFNDIVYTPPVQKEYLENGVESSTSDHDREKTLVFFGGDMQDFSELMELHNLDSREYSHWDLESTSRILQNQFPDHHIVVVRPTRMQLRTYSCFDNFVPSSNLGAPEHTPYNGSIMHLQRLLQQLSHLINITSYRNVKEEEKCSSLTTTEEVGINNSGASMSHEQQHNSSRVQLAAGDLRLIGFSKGCVVLNQFLYEFHFLKTLTPDDRSFDKFLSCFKDMYWLDGGHNGGKNTWITSRGFLDTLYRMNIRIHVHVTPYQISDERRPLIKKEEKQFSEYLHRLGAPIKRFVHFEGLTPTLMTHFQLLTEFGSPTVPNSIEDDDYFNE